MKTPSSLSIVLRGGSLVGKRWTVLLIIYLINLLLVLPIAWSFRSTLAAALGDSSVIGRMFTDFDFTVYDDFTRNSKEAIDVLTRMLFPLVIISTIIHALLGGGLAVSMKGEGTVREFMKGTGEYLGRSAKLLALFGLLSIIVFTVWTALLAILWSGLTSGNVVENGYILAAAVVVFLFLLPVAYLSLASEYARILTVRDELTGMFRAMGSGLSFVAMHPLRMIAMHGSLFLVIIVLVCVYLVLENFIGMTSAAGIIVVLLIQQASVFGRVAVRAWHTAAGVELAASLAPVAPAAPVEPAPAVHQVGATPQPELIAMPPTTHPTAPTTRKRPARRVSARKPAPSRRPQSRRGGRKG